MDQIVVGRTYYFDRFKDAYTEVSKGGLIEKTVIVIAE
jgi:hypothetical protein